MTTSPLHAIRQAAQFDLPDGKPMPAHLSHTLVILASHWPRIWPGQHQLAREMHVTRAQLNKRLKALEDAGMIWRIKRDGGKASTLYRVRGLSSPTVD